MAYNLADLFEHAVDAVPDRTALVCGDERRTFAELDERANRIGTYLLDAGVQPGDHVGIHAMNSVEWIEAKLGLLKIRAVPINVNYRYVEEELAYLYDNADLVGVVFDAGYGPLIDAVRPGLRRLRTFVAIDDGSDTDVSGLGSVAYDEAIAAGETHRPFEGERSGDDHYIIYTGGTTGMPKGVIWRSEDIFFSLAGGIDAYTNEPVASEHALADKARASEAGMVSMATPPLMHGAAQVAVLRMSFEGNTSVLVRKFDPREVWETIEREQVNVILITGDAMGRPLIEALDDGAASHDVSSLFVVSSSAALFSPIVKDKFIEHLPNALIMDAIGSTETGSNGMIQAAKGEQRRAAGGPSVAPAKDSVVLDDDLRVVEAGSDVVGRLARSGNVPIGYYKDPEKTAATFLTGPDGTRFAVAGDFARVEADGRITLLGRGSVSINTGGEKVFPEEVELALKAHPDVFDAVVVGLADDRWGQRVTAVVQPRPGKAPTLASLDEECRRHVAGYKVPRVLHLVDEIVRSPAGKPDYRWAKEYAESQG